MINKISDYFFNNLITSVWSILLSIGGIVMIFYYTSIEYLPLFDIQSLLIVVISIAFLFLTITSCLVFLNIMPSLTWYELFSKESKANKLWEENNDISLKKIFIWYSIPNSILISFILILIFRNLFLPYIFLLPIIAYLIFTAYIYFRFNSLNLDFRTFLFELLKFQFSNIVSSFMLIFPIYLIFFLALTDDKTKELPNTIFAFIFIGAVIFINTINISISKAIDAKKRFLISTFLGFFFLFFLQLSFDKANFIPLKIMEILKVGNFETEEILLKKEGCMVLTKNGLQSDKSDICSLKNVKILSRIGTETYLEFNNTNLSIPSEYITSWKIKKGLKNEKNPN